MRLTRRMRAGLTALKGERGFAVPTVLTVMVIGMGASAAAVTVATTSQGEASRDQNRKAALAIADAGVQRALFAYNKIPTTSTEPCVFKAGVGSAAQLRRQGPAPPAASPFCAPTGGSGDPDAFVGISGGYFTYWVDPCVGAHQVNGSCLFTTGGDRTIKIVSEGTQSGVSRRVAMTAQGTLGSLATGKAKAIGIDGITMAGWTEMEVPAATNKTFEMQKQGGCPGNGWIRKNPLGIDPNDGCPRICPGDWKYPVEVSVGPPPNDLIEAPGTQRCTPGRVNPPGPPESDAVVVSRKVTLAPVDIGAAKNANDDGRLGSCTQIWANQGQPGASLNPIYTKQPGCGLNTAGTERLDGPGTVSWNVNTHTLIMNGTGDIGHRLTLNLGARNYYFCRIELTGWSQLATSNATPMTTANGVATDNVASELFFDSPQNCPGSPSEQITVKDGSNIGSNYWNAFSSPPGVLPLVAMAGSSTKSTRANFQTTDWLYSNKIMLYAPQTDIILDTWARENEGWFAGKTIAMKSGAEIESPPTLDPIGVGIVAADYVIFRQKAYVECGAQGTTPDANC